MKFNLKNRPRGTASTYSDKYWSVEDLEKLTAWFEGFEKQETDRKERAENYIKRIREGFRFRNSRNESFWLGYIHAKKEILGE